MRQSIIKRGNALLTKACAPVTSIAEERSIIANMMDTLTHIAQLYEFKRGHGIAAPQIGVLKRINIVQYEGMTKILINPKMISHSYMKVPIREGCLSFFNVRGNVPRYQSIIVSACDENGSQYSLHAKDSFAMLLQHELDHLDGVLYTDRLANGEEDLYPVADMPVIP